LATHASTHTLTKMIRSTITVGADASDAGNGNDEDPERPSPTSVADVDPVSLSTKATRKSFFNRGRNSKEATSEVSTSTPTTNNNNNNLSDILLQNNQLKRQVTMLEHEKASLEHELLNQINTVVFDKETMVTTLQEKLLECEKRYKEERQAHADTRTSIRRQRLSSTGDAKLDNFRLQDLVEELNEEIDKLQAEKKKDNDEFLVQYNLMERACQAVKEENATCMGNLEHTHATVMKQLEEAYAARTKSLEEAHNLAIADLQRALLQKSQGQIQDAGRQLEYEAATNSAFEEHLAQILSLEESNNQLICRVSELSCQLLNEEIAHLALRTEIEEGKANLEEQCDLRDKVHLLEEEMEATNDKFKLLEAESTTLRASLEQQESSKESVIQELQMEVLLVSEKLGRAETENIALQASLKENATCNTSQIGELHAKVMTLAEKLEQAETENEALKVSLNQVESSKGSEIDILLEEVARFSTKLRQAETENKDLRHTMAVQKASLEDLASLETDMAVLNDKLSQTRSENKSLLKSLETQISATTALETKVISLEEQLSRKETVNNDISDSQEWQGKMVDKLRIELSDNNQQDSDRISYLEGEHRRQNAVVSALNIQLENLKAANKYMKIRLDSQSTRQATLEAEVTRKDLELTNLRDVCARNEGGIERLEKELESERGVSRKLSRDLETGPVGQCALEEEEKENATTTQASIPRKDGLEQIHLELSSAENRNPKSYAVLESEKDVLVVEVGDLRSKLAESDASHASMKIEMGTLGATLSSSHRRYEDLIASLQSEMDRAHLQNEDMRLQMNKLQQRCNELRLLLDASQSKESSLKLDLEDQQCTNLELQSSLQDRDSTVKELELQFQLLQEEVAQEQNTIATLLTSLGQEENGNAVLREQYSYTTARICDLEGQLQGEKEAVAKLTAALCEKEEENSNLRTGKEKADAAVDGLQLDRSNLLAGIDSMKQQLGQAEKAAADFEVDRLSLLNRIGSLKSALDGSHAAIESLENTLDELRASQEQKDHKVAAQEKDLTLHRETARQLHSQCQKDMHLVNILMASLQGSGRANDRLEAEQELLNQRLSAQSTQLHSLVVQNSDMKSSLDKKDAALLDSAEKADQLSSELESIQQHVRDLQDLLNSINAQLDNQESEKSSLQLSVEALRIDNDELKCTVERQMLSLSEAESKTTDLSNQLQQLRQESLEIKEKIETETHHAESSTLYTSILKTDAMTDSSEPCDDLASPMWCPTELMDEEQKNDPDKMFDTLYLKTSVACLQEERTSILDDHLKLKEKLSAMESDKRTLLSEIKDLQDQLQQKQTTESDSNTFLEEQQMESIVKATLDQQTSRDVVIFALHKEREELRSHVTVLQAKMEDLAAVVQLRRRWKEVPAEIALECGEHNIDCETASASLSEVDTFPPARRCCTSMADAECLKRENLKLQDQLESLQPSGGENVEKPKTLGAEGGAVDGSPSDEEASLEPRLLDGKEPTGEATPKVLEPLEAQIRQENALRQEAEASCRGQKEIIATLENQLSTAMSKAVSLEDQLEALQAIADDRANAAISLGEQVEALQTVVDERDRDEVSKFKNTYKELETTKAWLEKGLDEVEELRRKLSESSRLVQETEKNNKTLCAQIEELETELYDTKKSLAINLDEVERLQDSLGSAEDEIEETRKLLDSFKTAAEHWRNEVSTMKALKDDAIAKQMERESKLKHAYKREVGEYKLRVEEFEERLLTENQRLRAEIKELSGGSRQEAHRLAQALEAAEAKSKALHEDTLDVREQLKKVEMEGEKLREDLEGQLIDTKQQLKDIQQDRASLQGRLDDFEAARMEKILLEIEEQKEISKLQRELTVERDTVAKCKKEIQKLRAEVEELGVKCAIRSSHSEEIVMYKEEIQTLRAQSASLNQRCEEAVARAQEADAKKAEMAGHLSSQKVSHTTKQQLTIELEELRKQLRKVHGGTSEAQLSNMIPAMEQKLASVVAELKKKTKDLVDLPEFLSHGEETSHSREDLLVEIKELTEKTIVQGRINQTLQKKIEVLQQGREQFFEAKRKEIMRDHGQQGTLRKENTLLREKIREVTTERMALQSQLETFANSIGSSMSHLRKPSKG
jgi:chromosome segregation ATPase